MPKQPLEALMWAEACEAMERAERLHRQFFRRSRTTSSWEAPVDVYETDEALIIVVALPGVELDRIHVALTAGVLVVSGESPFPHALNNARIVRMEIPHGRFERRIELPPQRFELSARHLANGCLMLRLGKL